MSTKNTPDPFPWTIEKLKTRRVIRGHNGLLLGVIESGMADENAEAMLLAVNSHHDLVEALEFFLTLPIADDSKIRPIDWNKRYDRARAALSKANGEWSMTTPDAPHD